jgi:chitinase
MIVLHTEEEESQPDGMNYLNGAHPRSKTLPDVTIQANLQSWYNQQIPFSSIVKSGALVKKSDGTYGSSGGFTRGLKLFPCISCI